MNDSASAHDSSSASRSLAGEVRESFVSGEEATEGFRAEFRFASDLSVFDGHFPGHPMVPGVYLIEAVRFGAERALGRPVNYTAIEQGKFSQPVGPGDAVTIEATVSDGQVRATVLGGGEGEPSLVCRLRMAID
ncbi:MAG: hypothetical protein AAF488_01275 [Planctomycetota bacterium]